MIAISFVRATLVSVLVLAAGCGGETAAVEADAGVGGAAGQTSTTGGQAGTMTGAGGAGGLPDPGLNSRGEVVFSRDDHALCAAWPACSPGVRAFLGPGVMYVKPTTCQAAFDGVRMFCGSCSDASSVEFVGRCVAPVFDNSSQKPIGAWMLCTGFKYQPSEEGKGDPKSNAQMACEG